MRPLPEQLALDHRVCGADPVAEHEAEIKESRKRRKASIKERRAESQAPCPELRERNLGVELAPTEEGGQ